MRRSTSRGERSPPAATWERLSDRYERQLWLERAAVGAALDLADAGPSDRLLDLGTGTGEVLRQLSARPTRPRYAVGVDASAGMLDHVPPLPSGWTVRHGDALALPFRSGEFGLAIASYVLHVLPTEALATALAEVARVLRPGGRLVTVTPVVPARGPWRAAAIACGLLARLAPAKLGGLRPLDPRGALEQAGFRLLRGRIVLRGYPSLCLLAASAAPAVPSLAQRDRPGATQPAPGPAWREGGGD